MNEHECNRVFTNPRCNQQVLAELIKSEVKRDPSYGYSALKKYVKEIYGLEVSFSMVKRAKKIVLDSVVINFEEQFRHLMTYADMIRKSDPDATVDVVVHREAEGSEPIFERMYVCFGAMKYGFTNGCRNFLGLDGCFLKTITKGELLCAVGRDANNEMFPVAWAIVETETVIS